VLAKFPATAAALVRQASVEELLANPAVTAPFAVAGTLRPAEVAVLPAEWQYKIPQITCAALDARPAAATSVESESVAACEGATKQLLGPAELAGTDIDKANASRGAQGWQVDVELTAAGTQKFATLTGRLVQKRVAIVIDGTVASSPTIAAPITGGQVQISSSFTESDAKALAAVLGYGALDATLTLAQKNVITTD
jgi:preprotein translocase subunit SecD